jgi:hypothetical protein
MYEVPLYKNVSTAVILYWKSYLLNNGYERNNSWMVDMKIEVFIEYIVAISIFFKLMFLCSVPHVSWMDEMRQFTFLYHEKERVCI